jgi:hypothetical protein
METNRTENPEIKPHCYSHLIFLTKKSKTYTEEKIASATNAAGETCYLYTED